MAWHISNPIGCWVHWLAIYISFWLLKANKFTCRIKMSHTSHYTDRRQNEEDDNLELWPFTFSPSGSLYLVHSTELLLLSFQTNIQISLAAARICKRNGKGQEQIGSLCSFPAHTFVTLLMFDADRKTHDGWGHSRDAAQEDFGFDFKPAEIFLWLL